MTRILRFSAICALFALAGVSSFAQNSPLVGTVIDVDQGRNRLQIESDAQPGSRITVDTDSVSTVYQGFGTMIAGKPEIFTGSKGLSNLRLGDRIEVRASSSSAGVYLAQRVTLLGRPVAVQPTGVGQTRNPTDVATPTTDREIASSSTRGVEGTVRQVNADEGRIVIQTADRRMLTVRASRNTVVHYRGETYRISNLEIGDRIVVEADPREQQSGEVIARSIEVREGVQDTGSTNAGVVTTLSGRVTRVENAIDMIYVDDGRNGEVGVDMHQAMDANREVIRARDVRAGDQIAISGSYNRTGDLFLASTVRFGPNTPLRASDIGYPMDDTRDDTRENTRLSLVTMTGTVTETLADAATLGFRENNQDTTDRIWVTEAFIVRTRSGTYIRAESLRVNDSVVIDAYRDAAGNLIAQSIRLRNR